MMNSDRNGSAALKLGAPFGIGLYVHWTFALLVAYVLLFSGFGLPGLALVLALFGCVTLHEYGHALAARRYGIATESVTLYPVGGVARIASMPTRPSQELVIALAGPAVNVAIAAVLLPVALAAGGGFALASPGDPADFVAALAVANIGLVVFNLIPAFPMDGGRVLRSLLAMRGGFLWGTRVATRVGQGVAVLFALWALFGSANPLLIVIAFFVFVAAGAERRAAEWAARSGAIPGRPGPRATGSPPPLPDQFEWEVLPPGTRVPPARRATPGRW